MNGAAISADVIAYTSLSEADRRNLEDKIKEVLDDLTQKYEHFYGRIIQGDYIECAIPDSKHALRIALLLKTFIKSIELQNYTRSKGIKYFKEHGIRLALAVAPLTTVNPQRGIIDGEAIYLTGRLLRNYSTANKQRIVIKKTMFFLSPNKYVAEQFETIVTLLDTLIARCSAKQCEVIYLRLLGMSETAVSKKLGKNQSTISQHSTAAGWHAIEKAVNYFENYIDYYAR